MFSKSDYDGKIIHVLKDMRVVGGAERLVSQIVTCEKNHIVMSWKKGEPAFNISGDRHQTVALSLLIIKLIVIRLLCQNAVFHLHLYPATYFSLFLGRQSIIHEHNTYNRRRKYRIFRFVEAYFIYRFCYRVVAISDAVKFSLLDWLGESYSSKVSVIENFCISSQRKNRPVTGCNDSVFISMVGSFSHQKDQESLILSLNYLPSYVCLKLAGLGDKLGKCKHLAAENGLDKRVLFYGNVQDFDDFYSGVALNCLVSKWEGFGLVVLEAAQYGIPTLVSDVSGLNKLAINDMFLAKSNEPELLSASILNALKYKDSGDIGFQLDQLLEKYSYAKFIEVMNMLYVNLLKR